MLAGADIATIPTKVLKEMLLHPLTDKGLAQFLEDYKTALNKFIKRLNGGLTAAVNFLSA